MLLFGYALIAFGQAGSASHCRDSTLSTCDQCIAKGPECHWCQTPPTLGDLTANRIRCGARDDLVNDDCDKIGPRPKSEPITETSGSKGAPLKPRHAQYQASYGSTVTHKLEFTRPKNFDVDMFFVMDLSYSMKDDLDNLKQMSMQLTDKMETETEGSEFKIGFGSFVDRPRWPFINPVNAENPCVNKGVTCEPHFTYRTNAELTSDSHKFKDNLNRAAVSSNLDRPEDGLTAMVQAIQCGETGWRDSSFKILIFATDAPFKMAGDGLLSGLTKSNDGQCHMEKEKQNEDSIYAQQHEMDYPSVGRVLDVIKQNEISLILAVTEDYKIFYNNFKEIIQSVGKAEMGLITQDSSNLVQLVVEQYKKLSEHISLKAENIPDDVQVRITPDCGDGIAKDSSCDGIKANGHVTFTVELILPDSEHMDDEKCAKLKQRLIDNHVQFKVYGMSGGNGVTMEIDLECSCNCDDDNMPTLPIPAQLQEKYNTETFQCQNGGLFKCGVCSCPVGFSGLMCECASETVNTDACKDPNKPNENRVCSGLGYCDCDGRCVCNYEKDRIINGTYCEFDSDKCPTGDNGLTCSGRGQCQEDYSCLCDDGWSGEACGCEASQTKCGGGDGPACHGNGKCVCNQCQCDAFQNGYYTEEDNCKELKTSCSEHEDCARCIYETIHTSNSTTMSPECSAACDARNYHDIELDESNPALRRLINKHQHEVDELPDTHEPCETQWPEHRREFKKCKLGFGVRSSRMFDAEAKEKRINIMVLDEAKCPEPVNLLVVFGGVFGTLLLLGILILLITVLCIKHLQKEEVKEHDRNANGLVFSGTNPIYNKPETSHTLDNTRQPLVSSS